MVRVNATEFADKWGRRLQGATEDVRKGIERVTEAPGAKAAAQRNKWAQKLSSSEVQDKWARKVSNVSLSDWKKAALDKGVGRIAAGVQGAKSKMQAFGQALIPALESAKAEIDSMPSTTLEDNIARMNAHTRRMAEFTFEG